MAGLTACAPIDAPTKTLPIDYQLDAHGVAVSQLGKRIDFGRTDQSTISAMTKLVGTDPILDTRCDDLRHVAWSDGISLYFAKNSANEQSFRGWRIRDQSAGSTCA